jgi:transcriptional regulator of acetoin/glycerol metabolism
MCASCGNLVERVALLEEGERLELEHLPPELTGHRVTNAGGPGRIARAADARADGSRAHQRGAASHRRQQESRGAHPRISRQGLIEKIRRLRIDEGVGRQVS